MTAGKGSGRPRSAFAFTDLLSESLSGLVQRPGRSVLTMLGTVLGVGAFVAVLGLTATAGDQIGQEFDRLKATTVSVADAGKPGQGGTVLSFPDDADQRVERLNGVEAAGVLWQVPLRNPTVAASLVGRSGAANGTAVYAASPGALRAVRPTITAGTSFDGFHDGRAERVALVSAALARQLGLTRLDGQPAIFIDDRAFTVLGIYDNSVRNPETLLGLIIPRGTALDLYGSPSHDQPARMTIATRAGAAPLIAGQAASALRPEAPQLFAVTPPPDPRSLRQAVDGSLQSLFLLLAAVCLVIGAVGIANTTLVAVLERTGEIGLRRSLGARPAHIAGQFLSESTVLGTMGGLVGTGLGVLTVLAVTVARDWTAVTEPWTVVAAPFAGSLVGLLAGLYPALRAARVEPVDALRRG